MTSKGHAPGSETVNQGGASRPTKDERDREYDITGNVKEKGEDPSPDNRERGESAGNEPAANR